MNYLVLDLETTGDDPGWHDLVRISAILCTQEWKPISTFETLVYPKADDSFQLIPDRNPSINIKELKDAPVMFDAIDQFEEWIVKSKGLKLDPLSYGEAMEDVILCGHNFVHDYSFLRMAYGDDNKTWNFTQRMLDLGTLAHCTNPLMVKANLHPPKSWGLNAIVRAMKVGEVDEEYSETMQNADLMRRCFLRIEEMVKETS